MSGSTSEHAIAPAARDWIARTLGGELTSLTRMVVRREAWCAEIKHPDGSSARYFIRIDRNALRGNPGPRSLQRETRLIRYLAEQTDIPTQQILGWSDEHQIAIQSFVPGRADLHRVERAEQHSVMNEFMDIMARMHRIDVHRLDLPEFDIPPTPEAHSLMELDSVDSQSDPSLVPDSSTLLGTFSKRWLRNHVPRQVERTVLLQGDTGPGNFMFEDGHVTAVVDWEWAHLGDPMEDLGNLWVRDFFTPSSGGDLSDYFRDYARRADVTLDRQKIIYYLVHQWARSVVAIPGLVRRPDWQSPVAMNLGYQAVCDLACCEAIGLYHDIPELEAESLGIEGGSPGSELYGLLAEQLEKAVVPRLEDDFARSTATGAADIARYLERLHLHGPRADALELEGINAILGERHGDLSTARTAFNRELEQLPEAREGDVLRHCWGVAQRNMELMGPLVALWRDCRLARVEV